MPARYDRLAHRQIWREFRINPLAVVEDLNRRNATVSRLLPVEFIECGPRNGKLRLRGDGDRREQREAGARE